jgi:hypothetical protein
MRLAGRHVVAALLGVALLVLPVWILTTDPDAKLQALRTPLCKGGLVVEITNQKGGATLLRPDSGLKVRALADGEPVAARFLLYKREPGADWRYHWALDAPKGDEIFYLPQVADGLAVYVRALDPTGARCPADSATLTTGSAA